MNDDFSEIRRKISLMTDIMVRISADWNSLNEDEKEKINNLYSFERFNEIISELAIWEAKMYDEQ